MQMTPPSQPSSLNSVNGLTSFVTLVPSMDIIQSQRSVSLLWMHIMKLKLSQCFNTCMGIKVVNGYCFLGGFIGDRETTRQFLHNKITGRGGCTIFSNYPKLLSHSLKQLLLHYPNPCSLRGPTCKESFLVVRKHLLRSGTLCTNISGLPFLKVPSLIMKSSYSQFLHD